MHASANPATEGQQSLRTGIVRRFTQVVVVFALQAFLLFVSSSRLDWTWAWVFLGISLLSMLINGTILLRTSPETIAERGQAKETRDWDKIVSGVYALSLFLALPLVAGFDVRYGWTGDLHIAWHIAGAFLLAAGLGLGGWAMIVNAYFSTAVRLRRIVARQCVVRDRIDLSGIPATSDSSYSRLPLLSC